MKYIHDLNLEITVFSSNFNKTNNFEYNLALSIEQNNMNHNKANTKTDPSRVQ